MLSAETLTSPDANCVFPKVPYIATDTTTPTMFPSSSNTKDPDEPGSENEFTIYPSTAKEVIIPSDMLKYVPTGCPQ